MREVMWCEQRAEKVSPSCALDTFYTGRAHDHVPMLLVPKDAPSIVVRAFEFVDIDPADRQPPGVYRLTGEEVPDV